MGASDWEASIFIEKKSFRFFGKIILPFEITWYPQDERRLIRETRIKRKWRKKRKKKKSK